MLDPGREVLFVDDDPDDRFLLRHAWKGAGIRHALRELEGGPQALEYLSGTGAYADRSRFPLPALLLLDLKMPAKSGFDVLAWLRGEGRQATLPVIVLTASTSPDDVERAYRLGANSVLVKPSSLDDLKLLLGALERYWLTFNEFPR